jgi:hypothetical protein
MAGRTEERVVNDRELIAVEANINGQRVMLAPEDVRLIYRIAPNPDKGESSE